MSNRDLDTQRVTINKSDTPSSSYENHLNPLNRYVSTDTNPYQSPTASLTDNAQSDRQITNDSKWYQLSGRIGRLRYISYLTLMTILMYVFVGVITVGLSNLLTGVDNESVSLFIGLLFFLLLLPLAFYTTIIYPKRRLHDSNLSGWLAILMFIPLINVLFSFYLMFARGHDDVNQYGYPPRPNRTIHYIVAIIVPIFAVFIIGIIAAIAIPAYQDYIQRAQQVQLEQVL